MSAMFEQGSEGWMQQRLGKVTASKVADIIAKTKSGPKASRANYMAALVVERLTGVPTEGYTNAAMQWGKDHEADARSTYEFMTNNEVELVGFVDHPSIKMTGASPDGFIGEDGLIEIKCPQSATHIATLLGGSIDGEYITQIHWQMACTGRQWCDLVSFDPRLPASMRLFTQRVPRDDALIADLETNVNAFLAELDRKVAELRDRYEAKAAAA